MAGKNSKDFQLFKKVENISVLHRYVVFLLVIGLASLGLVSLISPEYVFALDAKIVARLVIALSVVVLIVSAVLIEAAYRRNNDMRKRTQRFGIHNRSLRHELDRLEDLNRSLRLSENKNKDIIDSVKDVIFETDESGRFIFLNLRWNKVTGFEIEQSIGQSLFSMVHPDDQVDVRQEFDDVLKGSKERLHSYTQIRKSDGTFGAVELSLTVTGRAKSGKIRLGGMMTDIEERRRTERALADAEKKYRNIVQNAAGGIYQLTPEGLYLSANPALARILGFSTSESLLRDVKNANESIYVDESEREKFIRKLEKSHEGAQHETQVYKKDGTVIWVNENARAVKDDSGTILFIEGSIEDITERKKSELLIRDAKTQSDLANRAKSEFLSNMSHELRTPLNSIIGFSEMIKNEVFGPIGEKAYWEYANDIYESGQGLLRVINEILDISRIEAGERQLNESIVDVRGVVNECLGLLEHKVKNNELTVTVALDKTPDIIGEALSVKQMMMNLLSNAIKFTPKDGRVTISSDIGVDGQLLLSVSDTGVGLDEDGIKKALSPFGQVNGELNRSGSGTGLGLTLVDSLINLHGGEFELFSQKGIGTTATLVFPAERVAKKEGVTDVQKQKQSQDDVEESVDTSFDDSFSDDDLV